MRVARDGNEFSESREKSADFSRCFFALWRDEERKNVARYSCTCGEKEPREEKRKKVLGRTKDEGDGKQAMRILYAVQVYTQAYGPRA